MDFIKKIKLPGLRNIKTAIAIVICLIIYRFMEVDRIILAVLAVLICMQDTVEKSFIEAKGRVTGNIFGALMALGLGYLEIKENSYYLWAILCGISVIIIIYTLNTFKQQGSIVLACAVFFIIAIDETPMISSVIRVVDTYVGITVALIVNLLMFAPKRDSMIYKTLARRIETDIKSIRKSDHKKFIFIGGRSMELYTYPKHSLFINKDFDFRISSRTINSDCFKQEAYEGYFRQLIIIEGEAKITHEDHYSVKLKKYGEDFYEGSWKTKTKGIYRDFILTVKNKNLGTINILENDSQYDFINKDKEGRVYNIEYYYCLEDNIEVKIYLNGRVVYEKSKKKKGA